MQEVWKTGAVGGYGALMVFYPNQNSSIAILSNQPRDIDSITTALSHALCLKGGSKEGWEGLYHIPSFNSTFSIFRRGSQYVFRDTHPSRCEIVLDCPNDEKQIVFPYGLDRKPHCMKKIEDCMCSAVLMGCQLTVHLLRKVRLDA